MENYKPEIEEDVNPLDEELKEQLKIADGYGDFLIMQKMNGELEKK